MKKKEGIGGGGEILENQRVSGVSIFPRHEDVVGRQAEVLVAECNLSDIMQQLRKPFRRAPVVYHGYPAAKIFLNPIPRGK